MKKNRKLLVVLLSLVSVSLLLESCKCTIRQPAGPTMLTEQVTIIGTEKTPEATTRGLSFGSKATHGTSSTSLETVTETTPTTSAPEVTTTTTTTVTTTTTTTTATPSLNLKLELIKEEDNFVIWGGLIIDPEYTGSYRQNLKVSSSDEGISKAIKDRYEQENTLLTNYWNQYSKEAEAALKGGPDVNVIFQQNVTLKETPNYYVLFSVLAYGYYASEFADPECFCLIIKKESGEILSYGEWMQALGVSSDVLLQKADKAVKDMGSDYADNTLSLDQFSPKTVFYDGQDLHVLLMLYVDIMQDSFLYLINIGPPPKQIS